MTEYYADRPPGRAGPPAALPHRALSRRARLTLPAPQRGRAGCAGASPVLRRRYVRARKDWSLARSEPGQPSNLQALEVLQLARADAPRVRDRRAALPALRGHADAHPRRDPSPAHDPGDPDVATRYPPAGRVTALRYWTLRKKNTFGPGCDQKANGKAQVECNQENRTKGKTRCSLHRPSDPNCGDRDEQARDVEDRTSPKCPRETIPDSTSRSPIRTWLSPGGEEVGEHESRRQQILKHLPASVGRRHKKVVSTRQFLSSVAVCGWRPPRYSAIVRLNIPTPHRWKRALPAKATLSTADGATYSGEFSKRGASGPFRDVMQMHQNGDKRNPLRRLVASVLNDRKLDSRLYSPDPEIRNTYAIKLLNVVRLGPAGPAATRCVRSHGTSCITPA